MSKVKIVGTHIENPNNPYYQKVRDMNKLLENEDILEVNINVDNETLEIILTNGKLIGEGTDIITYKYKGIEVDV
jgi:hypothetical protein